MTGGTEGACLRRATHDRARDRSRMAETPCGSVHESPVQHLPHAPKRKAGKTKSREWVSVCQRFKLNLELAPLRIPAMCYRPERMTDKTIRRSGAISMLMTSERRPAIRTMRGWAIDVLQEAGAIRECEEHGWMQDRADPHAWERAIDIAREDPPAGVSPDAAAAEVRDVLNSIGDTCPECPPD
jgi:hypothetical protein